MNLGEYQRAIKDFDEALRLDPQLAEAFYNLGFVYLNLGQYQRAIQNYGEAIRLDPQDGEAYTNRAAAYTLLGMDAEAKVDIERAVELGIDRAFLEKAIEELKGQR